MHEEEGALPMKNFPVTEVSWIDSVVFCNRLSRMLGRMECYTITNESENTVFNKKADGFRLLTDAEWQYACKAGTKGYRYESIDQIAWYQNNSNGSAQQVGQLLPNPWGLYYMLGNVWEWLTEASELWQRGSLMKKPNQC
jgi:formylglycine-generating enzyme required for sulfatase activity